MKPGASRATTGVRSMAMASSISWRTVSSAVSGPRTTSTRLMSGTGLKKCRPAMRSRRRHGRAIAAMRSEDVFDAMMQSSPTMSSSSRKIFRLSARSSNTASMTTLHSARSCRLSATVTRPRMASTASPASRPFSTLRARYLNTWSMPACAAPPLASCTTTLMPPCSATWAIPCPMAPAPTMPTTVSVCAMPRLPLVLTRRTYRGSRRMRNVPRGVYKDRDSRGNRRANVDQNLKSWRKDMRARLIEARLAVPPEARTEAAAAIAERLAGLVKPGQVFSFYWPMKGELDFRPLAPGCTR
jgi:hypothetical protein